MNDLERIIKKSEICKIADAHKYEYTEEHLRGEVKDLAQAILDAGYVKREDMPEVQKDFDEFWKEIVCNKDGSINIEQVKKELRDYHYVMQQVPEVYCHITGGELSYITYPAKTVIAVADDLISKEYVCKDDLRTLLD